MLGRASRSQSDTLYGDALGNAIQPSDQGVLPTVASEGESEEGGDCRVYAQAVDDLERDGTKQSALGREIRSPSLIRGWSNHSGFLVAPSY